MEENNLNNMLKYYSMSFEELEQTMFDGLLIFLKKTVGPYLEDEQVTSLAEMFRRFRNRSTEVSYSEDLCEVISDKHVLANRYIPRKLLRKDELAILLYNISPYALLNRKQTAMCLKSAFPHFFSSAVTINSTFTKFSAPPGTAYREIPGFPFPIFPEHSVNYVETFLLEIAKRLN